MNAIRKGRAGALRSATYNPDNDISTRSAISMRAAMEPFDTIDQLDTKDHLAEQDIKILRDLTEQFPDVAELWSFLGDAIERSNESKIPAAEPFACYQRAIECDPTYAPAHESAALYHDLFGELDDAELHFRAALEHGAKDSARVGLARILAQQGRSDDAALEMSRCIDQGGEKLLELRHEIADGLWDPDADEDAEPCDEPTSR